MSPTTLLFITLEVSHSHSPSRTEFLHCKNIMICWFVLPGFDISLLHVHMVINMSYYKV